MRYECRASGASDAGTDQRLHREHRVGWDPSSDEVGLDWVRRCGLGRVQWGGVG